MTRAVRPLCSIPVPPEIIRFRLVHTLSCRGSTAASRVAGFERRRAATLDPAVEPRGDRGGGYTIIAVISSSEMSAFLTSAIFSPRAMATIRSAIGWMWCRLWLMKIEVMPCSFRLAT